MFIVYELVCLIFAIILLPIVLLLYKKVLFEIEVLQLDKIIKLDYIRKQNIDKDS